MKKEFTYDIFPKFAVRTPLLPLDFLNEFLIDRSSLNERLKALVRRKEINEAIFIATPEFHAQLTRWVDGHVSSAKEEERLLQTLYKYLSRMSTRCTPFGLFAGCTTGDSGDCTSVSLSGSSEHQRHTRLDMLYLCNLASNISKHPQIINKIIFFPNTSIYKSGDHIRYIEYRYAKDKRTHHLVQIKNSSFIESILRKATKGESIKNLTMVLTAKGVPVKTAKEFIETLIGNQILINELDPMVTGEEFLGKILTILKPIQNIGSINSTLRKVNEKIRQLDSQIGNSHSKYLAIAEEIKKTGIDYDLKFLFQTDINLVAKKSSAGSGIYKSLLQGITALNKITERNSESNIQAFRDAFSKRYENREISLLSALDTETGIGYLQHNNNSDGDISPLIAGISLPQGSNGPLKIIWNQLHSFLLEKLLKATAENQFEIEITDEDLKFLEARWDDLPATFSSMVSIVEGKSDKYSEGRILMQGAGGSSGANMLGRFCHGNKDVLKMAIEITAYEQKLFGDTILAEIVHLPESRIGNVILRPVLRDYEIPFLTNPAVKPEFTIHPNDLFISLKSNELVLRSKKLNKRVIPRMSNSHNYSTRALPVYQFLCDLQNQNLRPGLFFNWGNLSDNYSFKPRIIYKNLIFSPAAWTVKLDELKDILRLSDESDLLNSIAKWRKKRNIPQKVLLEEGDNVLYVDLCNYLSTRTLLASVGRKLNFILKEFLFNPDNAIVKNKEGVFTNEFIFCFYKKEFEGNEA